MLNNFDTGKRKAAQHFQTENERRAAGESGVRTEAGTVGRTWGKRGGTENERPAAGESLVRTEAGTVGRTWGKRGGTENERRAAGESGVRTEAGTVGRTWGTAADMEGCDEAAAERKRAERSFATAAGHEGAVVLGPCGLREG